MCTSLVALQNCATVFNGGSQSVIANASGEIENISVEVKTPNGAYRSRLPATIVTSPSSFNKTTITVRDKCYEDIQFEVGKSLTPSFWVNFAWLVWFPVAMGVDLLTGNAWKMDNQVIVPLNKRDTCKK